MTEVLLVVGVIVFFITVCGSIMVGGHLLEELANAEPAADPAVGATRAAAAAASTIVSS